jgi:hypothetical protein
MVTSRIIPFVEHVVTGIYRDRPSQKKKVLSIGRNELTEIVGGKRLGPAQRDEVRDICRRLGIGLAELPNQFLFFDPDDLSEVTSDLNSLKGELKKLTDHFAKIHGSEAAEEDWAKRKFPKAE